VVSDPTRAVFGSPSLSEREREGASEEETETGKAEGSRERKRTLTTERPAASEQADGHMFGSRRAGLDLELSIDTKSYVSV
jgi:hypothetical protein